MVLGLAGTFNFVVYVCLFSMIQNINLYCAFAALSNCKELITKIDAHIEASPTDKAS